MTDDLVTWLRAQLDEDERVARAADGNSVFDGTGIVITHNRTAVIPSQAANHISRQDPGRVLREVEAKRRLIHRYALAVAATPSLVSSYMRGQDHGYREACLDALRDAAEVYTDRPGYRAEWRPSTEE